MMCAVNLWEGVGSGTGFPAELVVYVCPMGSEVLCHAVFVARMIIFYFSERHGVGEPAVSLDGDLTSHKIHGLYYQI